MILMVQENQMEPTVNEITLEFIKDKINDLTYPFGHGYIVTATIAGIKLENYN